MDSNKKRLSGKKETSRDVRTPTNFSPSQFVRPPTTGTSSSSSEDRSTSVKSSDDTSPEDIIKISPAPNNRAKETAYPSTSFKISRNAREGLDLKFDSAPSAYFTVTKSDLPIDVTLSPQDGNRIPSPASISSLTSRPLEWDSGADVGYIALGIETGLSTIERIALAQGSAILLPRSDPEGTTETSSKPVKIANPTIEKLIGTPAAESTVISSNMMSPISTSKPFYFQGVSPIISSSTQIMSRKDSPVEGLNDQMKQLEPKFENLCLEENNFPRNEVTSPSSQPSKAGSSKSSGEGTHFVIEDAAVEQDKNCIQVEPFLKASSAKEESMSKNSPNEVILNDGQTEHPLVLKKSASCSNLLQATQSVDLRFLKPLKRHFQNSASSSSISTVIDRSKKKSRKFFATSSLISEKSETRGKQFKSPRKILSPSKKLHSSSSKVSEINSVPKTPQKSNGNPPDVPKAATQNSQIAFHTSIQQSILDELQQCVNEISNNFNNSQNSHNKSAGHNSQGHKKKGSISTHGNCSTLESIASVQTNDSWTADSNAKESTTSAEKAKSFEYLPGDMYERNSSECFQAQKKMESSSSVSEKVDFSGSSRDEFWNPSSMNLFQLELDRGVNLLKNFIHNSTTFDSRRKQLLIKKIAKKLIDSEYESHQKSMSNEHPAVSQKVGPSETFVKDRFNFPQTNEKSSELSGSTQISQSYVESTSGSSCLNLVMRPLKKTISVESSSDHPDKISSGIRHIQENYCSNNRTFDLPDETKDDFGLTSKAQHQTHARTGTKLKEQQALKVLQDKADGSSVDYSKSSISTGNRQRVFYSSEYQWLKNSPSKNKSMHSPKYKKFSKFHHVEKKKDGESRILNENSDDLPDGRTVNLGRNAYRPFPNSTNGSSTKASLNYRPFYHQDWRKPTSDSERRHEENLIFADRKTNKKESALLYNYLDAERRNHLLWIQSEINHLSNLKALIEKQEKLKEGFKVLKTKKVDLRGDSQCKLKPISCLKKSGISSSAQTSLEGNDINLKASCQLDEHFSRSSSDKENKYIPNRTVNRANLTGRTQLGVSPINQSSKENLRNDSSSKNSQYISATSDLTNDNWDENSNKYCAKNRKKNFSTPSKSKKISNPRKKNLKPLSYTILFDPPKSTRGPFHVPTPKIIKNTDSSVLNAPEPSLQECLARRHPEIIKRVEFRKNRIAELTCLRQLQNERKKQLVLACGSVEETIGNPNRVELPSLKEKRIFSQKKLRQQTEKKYRKSFEVTQKLKEQKTKEDYRTNRLMADTFAKKLQRRTLQGQVDLSNSVMVIESR